MELYKKYRPKTLKDIVGNHSTVASLKNMLEKKTVPHTLMFHGPSGCGKTTLARILRRELNCSQLDFTELNCSNFRGIDTVRDITRQMNLAPTRSCRIWMLDEVHQMSKDGQNAALKILEDTPDHVYFFLCTTDPQKILKTIRSRCTEMPVSLLSHKELRQLIDVVCKSEHITISAEFRDDIADAAGGSARRCLVLLEKMSTLNPKEIATALKLHDDDHEVIELCRALLGKKPWSLVAKILGSPSVAILEPEAIRVCVLGYAKSVLLKSSNAQAAHVIYCFEQNFFDSREAGLVRACYEAVNE